MSIEITLLRVLKYRANHDKIIKSVPLDALDERTRIVLKDFTRYFREHDDIEVIQFDPFWLWFKMFAHPKLSEEGKETYHQLLKEMQEDAQESVQSRLMDQLVAMRHAQSIAKGIEKYVEGEDIDLLSFVRNEVEQFESDVLRKVKTPWVQDDINDLLQDDLNDVGLKWRLKCLNESMRPLRAGDFILLAARPDVGKTTFMTDQLTFMAPQLEALYPGEERTILWFNNEGLGKRIITRCYQSALNAKISDLLELQKKGTVKSEYAKAMGGRPDIIRIMDIHDFWNHEVEDVIRAHKPGLIVFDMVDNIKFGGGAANNGQRTDQLLEAMYQWARILSVKHDCPVLATSQVSADGEDMQYPLLGMLKDSKTGKQGAAEAIITVGFTSAHPDMRYIGTTKNKLHREGGPKNPRCTVHFDGARGRYVQLSDMEEPDGDTTGSD